ncbi:MAG: hypothetical protein C0508_05535 [Cyanobacteria bacterium PR.023]|jgi:hypothetical protein|nr:hypothetical protein [Cyanobacteria bacterium PR.023]
MKAYNTEAPRLIRARASGFTLTRFNLDRCGEYDHGFIEGISESAIIGYNRQRFTALKALPISCKLVAGRRHSAASKNPVGIMPASNLN